MLCDSLAVSDSPPETRLVQSDHREGQLSLPGLKLVAVEGPDRGREVTARRGVVRVGTAVDADFVLTDTSVSRCHLELRLGAELVVRDLRSTNGTRVDGVLSLIHI